MIFSQIQDELYRRLGLPAAPAPATITRLSAFINDTMQEVISEPGLAQWIDRNEPPYTFASVANQAVYGLANLPKILGLRDLTNDLKLGLLMHEDYRRIEPDPVANTGTPSHWVPLGYSAVALQPSNASELFVVSTSASDGAGTTAFLEGLRTGGYHRLLSVAMNGTTAVSFSSTTTDLIQVTKFYLSTSAIGTVTLREDSGVGTILATIPIAISATHYQNVALWPTPSSAITYTVDADREIVAMSNAQDQPPLPLPFHRLIVEGALWREFIKTDDDRRVVQEKRYYRGLAQLRYFLTCPADFLPSRSGRMVKRSRFGAYFPADNF